LHVYNLEKCHTKLTDTLNASILLTMTYYSFIMPDEQPTVLNNRYNTEVPQ